MKVEDKEPSRTKGSALDYQDRLVLEEEEDNEVCYSVQHGAGEH